MDYNTLLNAIRAEEKSVGIVNGLTERFYSLNGLDLSASSGYYHDVARKNVHPVRSQCNDIYETGFDGLSGWTQLNTGTGTQTVVSISDPDPAIGNVVCLKTGATIGSSAGLQRALSSIPASFGVTVIVKLPSVGTFGADALNFNIQNSENTVCSVRFKTNSVELFQDGAWQFLFAHGGDYFTEWWIEAKKEANGSHTVRLCAGTARVATRNGYLPGGAPGNTNLVWMQQFSGASNNRHSQIALLQVGPSALPDELVLTSKTINTLSNATIANILVLVENVSEDLIPNTNLFVDVSVDDGENWESTSLSVIGTYGQGVLDTAKPIRIVAGEVTLPCPGSQLRYQIQTIDGVFLPIRDIAVCWN